ncbi:MAG TPA: VanZ family protein [Eudoraea sp.]|nr:VanZ family protein [Eudoraea sp.]
MLKRLRYTIGFFSWMAIITLLSLVSFPDDDTPGMDIPHLDKAVHFTFYFLAALLGCFFLREQTRGGIPIKRAMVIMTISVVLYGIVIEVIQSVFTTERSGDFYDVLANSFGAFTGAAILKFLFSAKRQLKWKI